MKRALVAALPAVLVLGLVACGDDDDDAPQTVPATAESDSGDGGDATLPGGATLPDLSDVSIPDITMPDLSDLSIPDFSVPDSVPTEMLEQVLRTVLPDLDDEQIDCVVDELGGSLDLQRLPEIAETCGIDAGDITPGG